MISTSDMITYGRHRSSTKAGADFGKVGGGGLKAFINLNIAFYFL